MAMTKRSWVLLGVFFFLLLIAGTGFAVWYLTDLGRQVSDEDAAAGNLCSGTSASDVCPNGYFTTAKYCAGDCLKGNVECKDADGNGTGETHSNVALEGCENGCETLSGSNAVCKSPPDGDTCNAPCDFIQGSGNDGGNRAEIFYCNGFDCSEADDSDICAQRCDKTAIHTASSDNPNIDSCYGSNGLEKPCECYDRQIDWFEGDGYSNFRGYKLYEATKFGDECDGGGDYDKASCDGVIGSLVDFSEGSARSGNLGPDDSMTFRLQSSGTSISQTEICFHANFKGGGWSQEWRCFRDSTPGDGVFNFADTDPNNSELPVNGNTFTFNDIKNSLVNSYGYDPGRVDSEGIIWGANIFQSNGVCFSTGVYDPPVGQNGTCEVAPSCKGTLSLPQSVEDPNDYTISGRVYCSDPGDNRTYAVSGADILVEDVTGTNENQSVTTNQNGEYSVTVQGNPQASGGGGIDPLDMSTYLNVSLSSIPSDGNLITGQPYSELVPGSNSNGLAINCNNSTATGCSSTLFGPSCGQASLSSTHSSYSGCTANTSGTDGLNFIFNNCAFDEPLGCMESGCTSNSDCTGDYVCSDSGMCINDQCPIGDQDSNCICDTTNPDWGLVKNHETSCDYEEGSSYAVVDYTVRVSNSGDADGTLTTIVDTLDSDFNTDWIVSSSIDPDFGVVDDSAGTITWDFSGEPEATLSPGEILDLSYQVRIPEDGYQVFGNSVVVTPGEGDSFEVVDEVDVTEILCPPEDSPPPPPDNDGKEPLPDTNIISATPFIRGFIGVLVVVGSIAYAKSDSFDRLYMRLVNREAELEHKRKRFEDKVDRE